MKTADNHFPRWPNRYRENTRRGFRLSHASYWDFESEASVAKKQGKGRNFPDSGYLGCIVHSFRGKGPKCVPDQWCRPQPLPVFSRGASPFLTGTIMAAPWGLASPPSFLPFSNPGVSAFPEILQDAQQYFNKPLFCLNQPEMVSDTMANFLWLHLAEFIVLNFMWKIISRVLWVSLLVLGDYEHEFLMDMHYNPTVPLLLNLLG